MADDKQKSVEEIVLKLSTKDPNKAKAKSAVPEEFQAQIGKEIHAADIDWYKNNILPGFITWVNTIDPVLFMYYIGYCHGLATDTIGSDRPLYVGNWGSYRQFGDETSTGTITQLKGSIISKLRQFSQWIRHGQAQPNQPVPVGWNRPVQYLEALLEKIMKQQADTRSNTMKVNTEVVVLPVVNEPARISNLATHLKEFYLVAWNKMKVGEKGVLPAGIPKIILLTTEPVPFPDFMRRYALYVDFDSFAASSGACREMRKMDFPNVEAYMKLQQSGFPATCMEQSVAACIPATDVVPLLKSSLLQSTRGLKILDTTRYNMSDVGGMDYIRGWAEFNKKYLASPGFSQIDRPRGVIVVGPPGTGKSMSAIVIANELGWPCIDLEIGDLFGGLVGETETNAENALKVLKHVRQAVIRIDEIEKSLGGAASSNKTDGGTLNRVVGKLLAFMEANDHQCIVVATANNHEDVPGALMRSGRLDAIVFADVPSDEQRKAILDIHLGKKNMKLSAENQKLIVAETKEWSGKEIADALIGRVHKRAVVDDKHDETFYMQVAEQILKETVPIARAKEAEFKVMREWAKDNAVDANRAFT